MFLGDVHRWLEKASGGAGPVFRWFWAFLIAMAAGGLLYLLTFAVG